MTDIGVRELKINASEIIHKVKEKRARYIVTLRGHPVAVIAPIEEAPIDSRSGSSIWDELTLLGGQINQGWQSSQSSTEILSDMRK